jgi:hypothetical protein
MALILRRWSAGLDGTQETGTDGRRSALTPATASHFRPAHRTRSPCQGAINHGQKRRRAATTGHTSWQVRSHDGLFRSDSQADSASRDRPAYDLTVPGRDRATGSTRPAAMNSRTTDSGMRTWRPMRMNRMRRSAIRRRGNRSVVPSSSATSATVRCRSMVIFRLLAITPPSRLSRLRRRGLLGLVAWLRRERSPIGGGRLQIAAAACRMACSPRRRAGLVPTDTSRGRLSEDQGGASRRRWPDVSGRLCLGGPPAARRATLRTAHRSRWLIAARPGERGAVFLAPDCPARGHRV